MTFSVAWEPVGLDASYGTAGFSISSDGLVWNGDGFGGWLGKSLTLSLIALPPSLLNYVLTLLLFNSLRLGPRPTPTLLDLQLLHLPLPLQLLQGRAST